jgi:hypothetical protein
MPPGALGKLELALFMLKHALFMLKHALFMVTDRALGAARNWAGHGPTPLKGFIVVCDLRSLFGLVQPFSHFLVFALASQGSFNLVAIVVD